MKSEDRKPHLDQFGLDLAAYALVRFADEVILLADSVDSGLENNPNLQSPEAVNALDPEAWAVARGYARRIVGAVRSHQRVDPAWLDGIANALQ